MVVKLSAKVELKSYWKVLNSLSFPEKYMTNAPIVIGWKNFTVTNSKIQELSGGSSGLFSGLYCHYESLVFMNVTFDTIGFKAFDNCDIRHFEFNHVSVTNEIASKEKLIDV